MLQKASEEVETTYPGPPEFVAQGDRVLVIGVATGKIKVTNKAFKDEWVFDITVRNGKSSKITAALSQGLYRCLASRTSSLPLITIGGVELLRRIHKDQFGLSRLRIKGQAAPATWNAVLGA